jgi:hypothetical protein
VDSLAAQVMEHLRNRAPLDPRGPAAFIRDVLLDYARGLGAACGATPDGRGRSAFADGGGPQGGDISARPFHPLHTSWDPIA